MKCLVTGGAGFIGSHIVEALVERGHTVRVLDNLATGFEENLQAVRRKIEFIHGDLRDQSDLHAVVRGVDVVFHEAAIRSVMRSIDDPLYSNEVNATGTLKLLVVCRQERIKRLIYASSSSVYGDVRSFPQRENTQPRPVSPYAVSKLTGELYVAAFAKTFGLETVSLRYFNVFGPRQKLESQYALVVPQFIHSALAHAPLEIHSDGKQSRDFTYIDNVVHANLLAAVRPGVSGEVFNVACGKAYSILQLAQELERLAGHPLEKKFYPLRMGDVRKTLGSVAKANRLLKYKPPVDFHEGMRRAWAWYQKAHPGGKA